MKQYEQQIAATCNATLLRCNLKRRCCTYYHPPQTLSRNKISLLKVEAGMLQQIELFPTIFFQLATTKFCCVTMFEVGSNTCNDASFQENVARITGPYLFIYYLFKFI